MPQAKQAKKRMRQDAERRLANKGRSSAMKTAMKRVLNAVAQGDINEARRLLPIATKRIDKAAKQHVIHSNNAARKKSRLSRAINQLASA